MEEIEAKEVIAAAAAVSVAIGSYAAYSSSSHEPADLNPITDEVVEKMERGEKVEVRCDRDGHCTISE